jgi:hypothetical protein
LNDQGLPGTPGRNIEFDVSDDLKASCGSLDASLFSESST